MPKYPKKYTQNAGSITCDTHRYKAFGTRKYLHIELNNKYDKDLTFYLMNPSDADQNFSDATVNRCIDIAYSFFGKYEIGSISIVNVLPFYEPKSAKLQNVIQTVKSFSLSFYENEITSNLKVVKRTIKESTYVFLATGGIPNVDDKTEYRKLIHDIYQWVEESKGQAFIGKKYNDKGFPTKKYSRHIHPFRRGFLEEAQLHDLIDGKFIAKGDPFKVTFKQ
ncbi:DUF1643 domain-containing protein [Sporolactobacillus sp. STCC-11]|uniref:DUF1643 domain-containing protein n=1 Tax=Sporolactobacillus caesalpiniae TaxID=3230362 RepID=UPI0033940DF0